MHSAGGNHAVAPGIYRGVVAATNDPAGKGRIKVKVPQLLGKTLTDWAWPKSTASVSLAAPKVGQGVWVMFEGGDPAFPVWVGTFGASPVGQRPLLLKPLDGSVSLTSAAPYLVLNTATNGVTEIDAAATIVTMANKLANLEARLTALEGMP